MIANSRCIACILSKQERKIRKNSDEQKKKELALEIIERLRKEYTDADCTLDYNEAWKLLVSVRLAAQCTDARVNLVTPALFTRFPTLEAFAAADPREVGEYIHSCGFYKHKAEDIVLACRMLRDEYGGKVPGTMEQLLRLPGVGRKTANLLLGDIYGTPGSVVCDTHCIRITGRLGLTDGSKDPLSVEKQLRAVLPVYFISVIFRWIMTCCYHNSCCAS